MLKIIFAATGTASAGYFGGGFPGGNISTTDKVTYSSDTTAAVPGAALSAARQKLGATGNPSVGYFSGGNPSPTTADKVNYSTDTTSRVPGANLSAGIREMGSTGNPSSGFYGGGSPGDRTQVDKLSYSSETTARVPAADLSVARYQLAATSGRENALPSAPSSKLTLRLIQPDQVKCWIFWWIQSMVQNQ